MRFIAAISVLFALILSAAEAHAEGCSCSPDPFEKRWGAADAVFTATVVEIKEQTKYIRKGNANDLPVTVLLRVDESFKGPASKGHAFELWTSLTKDTCTGHPFEKDKQYLVFAYQRSDQTYAPWSLYNMPSGTYDVGGLCGGTKNIADPATSEEIEKIRKKLAAEPKDKSGSFMDRMFGN